MAKKKTTANFEEVQKGEVLLKVEHLCQFFVCFQLILGIVFQLLTSLQNNSISRPAPDGAFA